MDRYRKTITAVVGAVIAWVTLVLTSAPDSITGPEWLSGAIGLATALGVYGVPNDHTTETDEAAAAVYREVDPDGHPGNPL